MPESYFYVISYDIRDDRRRTKVAKMLEDFGDRVQYSVFELVLERPQQLRRLQRRLLRVLDESEDSVRIYSLCSACHGRIELLGQGQVVTDKAAYVV